MKKVTVTTVTRTTPIGGTKPFPSVGIVDGGGGGVSDWSAIHGKPFERLGETLKVQEGTLEVNIHETANEAGGQTVVIG